MLLALSVTQVVQSLGVTGIVTIIVLAKLAFIAWLCFRFMPNNSVGVVEKLWSSKGSVPEGHILALNGEAGYQADLLRGGVHFGLWRWQYRVHTMPLVTIPQGKVGWALGAFSRRGSRSVGDRSDRFHRAAGCGCMEPAS